MFNILLIVRLQPQSTAFARKEIQNIHKSVILVSSEFTVI